MPTGDASKGLNGGFAGSSPSSFSARLVVGLDDSVSSNSLRAASVEQNLDAHHSMHDQGSFESWDAHLMSVRSNTFACLPLPPSLASHPSFSPTISFRSQA